MRRAYLVLASAGLFGLIVGCGQSADADGAQGSAVSSAPSAEAVAEATALFKNECAACHGVNGTGDGPGAVALDPKPRNFHLKDWQASVTDVQIAKTIQYGGAAVGKSPAMPAHPQLAEKQDVIQALVAHVRSLKDN